MHPELHELWAACTTGRDSSRDVDSLEARALARAVENSIDRGTPDPELRRLAGEWGSRYPDPESVVSDIKSLRGASSDLVRMRTRAGEDAGARLVQLLAVLDDVLLGAVEGVSSSLREAALTDPLTGCGNRRALEDDLRRAVAGARRTGLEVSVAVIDLDGLKRINDTHGHAEGDAALKALAQALVAAARRSDAVYRVGGDEFIVLVPFSDHSAAEAIMRRANDGGAPSFSWGVATLSMLDPGSGPDDLVAMADASLYARRRRLRPELATRPPRHRIVLAVAALALAGLSGVAAYDRYSVRSPTAGAISHVHVHTLPARKSTTPSTSETETTLPHKQSRSAKTVYGGGLSPVPIQTVTTNPVLTVTVQPIKMTVPPAKTPVTKVPTVTVPPVVTTPHAIPPPRILTTHHVTGRWSLPPWMPPVGTRIAQRHRCGIGGIDIFERSPHYPVDLRFGHTPDWNFPY